MSTEARIVTIQAIGFSEKEKKLLSAILGLSYVAMLPTRYTLWEANNTTPPDLFIVDADTPGAVAMWQEKYNHAKTLTLAVSKNESVPGLQSILRPLNLKLIPMLDRVMADARKAQTIAALHATDSANNATDSTPIVTATFTATQHFDSGDTTVISPMLTDSMLTQSHARDQVATHDTPIETPTTDTAQAPSSVASLHTQDTTTTPTTAPTAEVQPTPQAEPQIPPASTTTTTAEFNILTVDDSPLMRAFLENRLAAYGVCMDFAGTAEEALQKMEQKRFEIVFLDVMLPGMDGYEACKIIKKNKNHTGVRVIMLTSKDRTFDKIRGTMAGCDGYLTKPVDEMKLRAIIERHVFKPQ